MSVRSHISETARLNFVRFSARVPVAMARSVSDDDSAACYVLYDTIQHNKSIYNARVVSLRAESVVRAGQSLGGKMARCGSERRRGKNNVVRFLLKEANNGRAIANFEREFILPVLSTMPCSRGLMGHLQIEITVYCYF